MKTLFPIYIAIATVVIILFINSKNKKSFRELSWMEKLLIVVLLFIGILSFTAFAVNYLF
ncbi:MAG: hypothetical protein K9J12_10445 [Melioribacteraceae bacterium]|nr:hypothetical protein [Melioribacteraceae bacterium]MCF8265871.1 hypothetical protein [Melioribacteraceae bacterium]MCF8414105.1 hypothetical protein [Melioribacteraceae bacterium]MCF8432130.1 hypothetical protein [Melioribacteraceae bacterium]